MASGRCRITARGLAAAGLFALVACATPSQPPLEPEASAAGEASGLSEVAEAPVSDAASQRAGPGVPNARAEAAIAAINAYRAGYGLPALRYAPALAVAAQEHVRDLADRGAVATVSADGAGVLARTRRAGYEASSAGSLVAGGYRDFAAALEAWRADEEQRARLLLPSLSEIGIGFADEAGSKYRYYIETIIAAP